MNAVSGSRLLELLELPQACFLLDLPLAKWWLRLRPTHVVLDTPGAGARGSSWPPAAPVHEPVEDHV